MSGDHTWDAQVDEGEAGGYLLTVEETGTEGFHLVDEGGEAGYDVPAEEPAGPPILDLATIDETNAATLKAMEEGDGAALREYGMYILVGDNHDPAWLEYVDGRIPYKGAVWMESKGGITGPGKLLVTNAMNQPAVTAALGRVSRKAVKFR